VAGAEVGDPDLACTIIEARVQKCMRVRLESGEGVELLCQWHLGSRARWQRGWLESREGDHGSRI
jgi:uncharacterized protein (DUF2267 family)